MNSQLFNRVCLQGTRKFHVGATVNTSRPSSLIDSIIRVDHAGELGADRIYAGQMAVLGNTKVGPLIQHMWDQEKVHKATFEELIVKHRVRPTVLVPVWNIAGFLLGAGTALMGEKAAMACTVAVESVIVDHYNDQLRTLMSEPEKNEELMKTIQKFRDDEQEHHDHGLDHGAEQAPFYKVLSEVIKFGCKTAIAMSKGLLTHQNNIFILTTRNYSTSTKSKVKWDLYSSICLERKPTILKPLNDLEKKVLTMFSKMEMENSFKSDHEIKIENYFKTTELLKSGSKIVLDSTVLESPLALEELWNKEYENFKPASRISSADEKNDVRSINRKLDTHLYLLIYEKIGKSSVWIFPHGPRKDSETMRETAERILREKCGENLNTVFLGNAPCGFYKYLYPKSLKYESHGAKIFFFKALYKSGVVELNKNYVQDYQWATSIDLKNLINTKTYFKSVSKFLFDSEDTLSENVGINKL